MIQTKLKQWRKSHGLSQKELAERLNVGTTIVGLYDSGKQPFSIKTAIKWAAKLGISYKNIYSSNEYIDLTKKLNPELFSSFDS